MKNERVGFKLGAGSRWNLQNIGNVDVGIDLVPTQDNVGEVHERVADVESQVATYLITHLEVDLRNEGKRVSRLSDRIASLS